jgi:hypothetical protein
LLTAAGVCGDHRRDRNRPLGERTRLVGEVLRCGRTGTGEDLVGLAAFLASGEAGQIVAQTCNVGGGQRMS